MSGTMVLILNIALNLLKYYLQFLWRRCKNIDLNGNLKRRVPTEPILFSLHLRFNIL